MRLNKLYFVFATSIIILLGINTLQAQTYSNSWINYSQKYYYFKVYKSGVYRISYSALANMGIPVGTFDPRNFQIFNNGEEQYIYVNNENTGVFTSNDYIEIYCKKNDGTADLPLYGNPADLPVIDNSLFTDTAVYYLTWNSSFNNRRVTIDNSTNYTSFTEVAYVYKNTRFTAPIEAYSQGIPFDDNYYHARYTEGEGFYDFTLYLGGTKNYTLSTKNSYTGVANSTIDFVLKGSSNYSNLYNDHHTRFTIGNVVFDTIFPAHKLIRGSFNVPTSSLGATSTVFKHQSIDDLGSGADATNIALINLKYPHTLNFESTTSFEFVVPDHLSQSKSYLNITGFTGGNLPVLYDLTNKKRIIVTKNGTNYQSLVANSGSEKRCFIAGESQITQVSLTAVSPTAKFTDILAANPNADYIIISHPSLMGSDPNYKTATDYADYRTSTGYNVLLVNINDLYEQYSYGIMMSPLAIKNFLKRAYYELNSPPKHLFIIGKSYYPDVCRKNSAIFNQTFVPSYGNPPSDAWLSQGIIDSTYLPAIATGRLAAQNLEHIDLYLDKMIKYEEAKASQPEPWMKKSIFFSGGTSEDEQEKIRNYMANYENIYEDTAFGGSVFTIYKTSSDPIQSNLTNQITNLINNGVFMLNFFGHAAGVGFDINVDHPENYSNYGKYPFLIANSCYAGDIFQTTGGTVNSSETFILIRDKGAICYLSSVTPGFMPWLNVYTSEFMKNLAYKNYGNSLGSNILETVKNIKSINPNIEDVSSEMVLHGDPGLILYSFEKPDYEITNSSIIFNPQTVSTSVDSFEVKIAVANIGKAIIDTLLIEVTRTLPNATKTLLTKVFPAPKFNDTISFYFKTQSLNGVGTNKLEAYVYGVNPIQEISTSNNKTSLEFVVYSADLKPVYPPEFAIVPNNSITLSASTYYPLSAAENYVFQIDTSAFFDSPLFMEHKVNSSGGVVNWQVPITLIDSTVYFWRVSKDSTTSAKGYTWRNSSFQYIPNRTGWSQSNYYQFENDLYKYVNFNKSERNYKFVNHNLFIEIQNGNPPTLDPNEVKVVLNGGLLSYWHNASNGMMFFVFNQTSGDLWMSQNNGSNIGTYLNYHERTYDLSRIEFPTVTTNYATVPSTITDSMWYRRMADFIGMIPFGETVLAMNFGSPQTQNFPEYLKKSFDTLGSNYIRSMYNNQTYILFGKKGDFGGAREVIGTDNQTTINLEDTVQTSWTQGSITSTIIGPSKKWQTLNWKQYPFNNQSTDSVRLSLIGITPMGVEDTIIQGLSPDTSTVTLLENIMPAANYPYCKLITYMKDDSLHTPGQMDHWQIFYTEAPELAIAPKIAFSFFADTIEQGDTGKIVIGYQNISQTNSDSVLVKYWIIDANKVKHDIMLRKIAPINAGGSYIDSLSFPTLNLLGRTEFYLEINTVNPSTNAVDQIETSHINNSLSKVFFVKQDDSKPILDVTFDGVHILDGDIVSPKPEIMISLTDDNNFIQLDDTSLFKVYLKSPTDIVEQRIHFYKEGVEYLRFIPAELPKNTAKIVFNAEFVSDGEYTLILQATDKSGNSSSPSNDYKISFEVINKSTITEVMNWPNPFTTKTHFVFTLTGSQVPDYFLIQVMTVSGHVVREITMSELGPIHIGRNITEFTWDGTDQYGDRLANGVYLYRVITRINGQDIENSASGADKFFKNNFGKMYLMR